MPEPVCDLILLSWNHLEQTQPCLESLFATVKTPSRLFIVDNGSEPAVRAALQQVKPSGHVREVVVLQNETNEGFPKGMNRGIHASTAPYVCLLNNDLRFMPGWLEQLIHVAEQHQAVGVLNPTSNNFGNHPPDGMPLEAYAASLQAQRGKFVEVGMCIGFCVLIARRVLDTIGGLTEEVERIFFEDEDFSVRAQRAGFVCAVAAASYVVHVEHQTVKHMPERDALFGRNRNWCHTKWGRWVRIAWPRFTPISAGTQDAREWLEELLFWARKRAHVYVYCAGWPSARLHELFDSVQLVPHADIHWHTLPPLLPRWSALAWILKRRKKRFDIIVAPDTGWAGAMRRLGPVHRATVVSAADQPALESTWNACRSQL
jgi:GT2 family glycosyltransferase